MFVFTVLSVAILVGIIVCALYDEFHPVGHYKKYKWWYDKMDRIMNEEAKNAKSSCEKISVCN